MSIEGGLDRAVERAARAGCNVLQIFTKSSNQWRARELVGEEIARFQSRLEADGIGTVAAHDSYLINLASPDEALFRKSVDALREELKRCEALGIPFLIAHPGAHVGSGLANGIRRIAAALDEVHGALPRARVRVLLEITAGQGSTIGSRFEEIAEILDAVGDPERVGVCFDTCHAFAAGYDIRGEKSYRETFDAVERLLGIERLQAFHLNDCKKDLGCRLDRHEHIGKGWIGLEAFRLLMNDPRFQTIPMFLETPKGPELAEDIENLATLRSLIGERRIRKWAPPTAHSAAKTDLRVPRNERCRASRGTAGRGADEVGKMDLLTGSGRPRTRR